MEHISLADLNSLIKDTLNDQLAPSYWVVAEIAEFRTNSTGHAYLELIEKEEETGQILAKARATIWSYTYRKIAAWFQSITGEQLKGGMTVLANLQVQYHEVYGLSFNIKDIDPNFTLGERARKKQEIIKQLQEDGIFDMNKGLALPLVPQRIAIISSETAAGYGDFINQIRHNEYGYKVHTRLFPASMQGDKAPESIIQALLQVHEVNEQYDAVIVIRGGGAQVDLDCFDHYELAAHIAQFSLPVFTGIGHERDETICDLVAHSSLKTPTAVAEFILRGMRSYHENLQHHFDQIIGISERKIEQEKYRLQNQLHLLHKKTTKLLNTAESRLNRNQQLLHSVAKRPIEKGTNRLQLMEKTFELINPASVFKKGYSYTSINGESIQSKKLKAGDELRTINADQDIISVVKSHKNK